LTQLLRETFGGNSLSVGIFSLQYGDSLGSTLTLRALKRAQAVLNYPVINDNRTIGLLRKYRVESMAAANSAPMSGSGDPAIFNLKVAELEKKLIEENLQQLRFADDKQRLLARMQEMKSKFTDLV
jgi:hypothetical protein